MPNFGDIVKFFFGENSDQSPDSPEALNQVMENLQIARDQASQAEDAAGQAGYGSDRDSCMSAAANAQQHANACREAADRAAAAAEGGPPEASEYASQARGEAMRAQSAADRANAQANSCDS